MKKIFLLLFFALFYFDAAMSQNAEVDRMKKEIRQMYVSKCNEINAQLPMDIDETLTLEHVVFCNWTISASYVLHLSLEDLTNDDRNTLAKEIRKNTIVQAKRMIASGNYMSEDDMKNFVKTTGIKYRQSYYDDDGLFICSVIVGYKELFGGQG